MSTPFFNEENTTLLHQIARGWLGVPFHPNGRTRYGVSCQMLMENIYKEVGFLEEGFDAAEGPMNWSRAHKDSLIEPVVDGMLSKFESVDTPAISGDLLGFKVGGCVHHLGICLGNDFIHCLQGYGVHLSRMNDATFQQRLARTWRPIK